MKKLISLLLACLVLGGAVLSGSSSVVAQTPDEIEKANLEGLIRNKSEELERINNQLATSQQNLQETRNQRSTLQRELNQLLANIKQLELNIEADKVANQKLGLEIDSLNYDIRDIQLSVENKRSAIAHVLRELQAKDDTHPLISFLRNSSLSDSIMEAQSLFALRNQLSTEINRLTELHNQLGVKVKTVSDKKTEIEFRQVNLAARKSLIEDQQEERRIILTQTKSKESAYEQQVAELKKQQDQIEDEISGIENQLRSKFDTGVLPNARPGIFAWPIKMSSDGGPGRISQHFGEKSSLYRGKPHNGLDIAVPVGTPVFAADDGVIMAVDNNDRSTWSKYQYGRYVLIKHPNGLATLYAHLSKQSVSKGDTVKRGDLIGYSGNTGYSTGAHLHFGAYWAASMEFRSIPPAAGLVPIGVVLNPEDYLSKL